MRFLATVVAAFAALASTATAHGADEAAPVQHFRDNIHKGVFHPTQEAAFSFLKSAVAPEHLQAEFADSQTFGAWGRGLVSETIKFASHFLSDKTVVRSNDSKEYPYWRMIPLYIDSAIPDGKAVSWTAPCFKNSSAAVTTNKDGSYTLTLTLEKASSLTCSDNYMFATLEGLKLESFFMHGTHKITWTPDAKTVRDAEKFDINTRGIRVFRFIEDTWTAIADLLDTALLFEPLLTKAPSEGAEKRNLDFLTKYAQHFKMNERAVQSVPIDQSLINSGDFIGIMRLDGLDPMLAWAMGSATGHTTIAMRIDGELFVCESTSSGNYWPTNGIQKTPYATWIAQAKAAGYNMLWAPLKAEERAKFNETAALDFFAKMEGVDYGYYNMLMAWIDTLDSNYPCLPPDFQMCMTWHHVEIILGMLDKFAPATADLLFGQAFNLRLGTEGLRPAEIFQAANAKGITDLRNLPVIPEDDNWKYTIKRYNETTKNTYPSMVCCVFVCHMWKAGGLFADIDDEVNCGELTNADDYMMTILDDNVNRPAACVAADPDNKLCQLEGKYSVTFVDYSSRDPSAHMGEKCPSLAPNYTKPLGC